MSHKYDLLAREEVVSIRGIQRNPLQALKGFTRVIRGSKTIGFFLSNEEMDNLFEDLEAAASHELCSRVKEARRSLKKSDLVSLENVAAMYGV
ncbi:hypothetical protein HZA87_01955 [Candidatus Uhrbacteria bacterium]|nr:hypothetical protein [Candidatus Uhrbacteria bacterium]